MMAIPISSAVRGCKSKFEADPDRYINKDQKNASCTCTASEAKNAAVTDPVCGMTVDPHKAKYGRTTKGALITFAAPDAR